MEIRLSTDMTGKIMHLFKEENVQITYPKRKPAKPASHYILPIALLAIMVLLINALHSVALPDPLGDQIRNHMIKSQPISRGGK